MPIPGSSVIIEGHAIVSDDGMIAAADGSRPAEFNSEADWRFYQAALDRSVLVVLGRLGHAKHSNPGRRRLVVTHSVTDLASDPADDRATYWNPAGLDIVAVLDRLGIGEGTVAISGGTGTFDLFVPYYDRFILAEIRGFMLPDGIPCFSKGHPRFVLPGAGLEPREMEMIDRRVLQTHWVRTDRRAAAG